MQHRASGLHRLRDALDRLGVRRAQRVGEDQAEVYVADHRTESTVGEAAEGVGGHKSFPESLSIGAYSLGQYGLALRDIMSTHARHTRTSGQCERCDRCGPRRSAWQVKAR